MVRISAILSSAGFRDVFHFPDKNLLRWFPGHMGRGIKQMQQKLKLVDCVVEVHDSRIPISGRNEQFRYTVSGARPHILVLNKKDLTDMSRKDDVVNYLNREGINEVLFTNCKDQKCSGLRQLVPTIAKLIEGADRYNRSGEEDYSVMIIGVPNVGKSSVINALRSKHMRRSKATAVGALAGITRKVATRIKVCSSPPIYVLDTPGILDPRVTDLHAGLKLALCSSMQDHLVGVRHIADYLLYFLNKNRRFDYVEQLGLIEPLDAIEEVLIRTAVSMGKTIKRKDVLGGGYNVIPNLDEAARHFIKLFRDGHLGKFLLDDL